MVSVVVVVYGWMDGCLGDHGKEPAGGHRVSSCLASTCLFLHLLRILIIHCISTISITKFYVSRHVSNHSLEARPFSWTCAFSQHHDTCCPSVNPSRQKTDKLNRDTDWTIYEQTTFFLDNYIQQRTPYTVTHDNQPFKPRRSNSEGSTGATSLALSGQSEQQLKHCIHFTKRYMQLSY